MKHKGLIVAARLLSAVFRPYYIPIVGFCGLVHFHVSEPVAVALQIDGGGDGICFHYIIASLVYLRIS